MAIGVADHELVGRACCYRTPSVPLLYLCVSYVHACCKDTGCEKGCRLVSSPSVARSRHVEWERGGLAQRKGVRQYRDGSHRIGSMRMPAPCWLVFEKNKLKYRLSRPNIHSLPSHPFVLPGQHSCVVANGPVCRILSPHACCE